MRKSLLALGLMVFMACSSAFAYTEDDITYDTECGEAGIGKKYVSYPTQHIEEILPLTPTRGLRINEEGYFQQCTMPVVYDCRTDEAPQVFFNRYESKYIPGKIVRGPTCTPMGDIRAGNVGEERRLSASRPYFKNGVKKTANFMGHAVYQCQAKPDGSFGWVMVEAACR